MPYLVLEVGLYLITQISFKNGVQITHYGILDVGNVLGYDAAGTIHPIVFHQTPPRLRVDYLCHTGEWIIIGKISDVQGAAMRIQQAFQNPHYDLFGNNCEHFARYVAEDRHYSGQAVAATGVVLAGFFLAAWALSDRRQLGA